MNRSTRTGRSRRLERSETAEPTQVEEAIYQEVDYSAYYSRDGADAAQAAEPAFAPPPKMDQYLMDEDVPLLEETDSAQSNVYRTRAASWVDEDERSEIYGDIGYQVREDVRPKRKKKKGKHRGLLVALLIVLLLLAGLWLMREPIMQLIGLDPSASQSTQDPFTPIVTPEPIKPYDAAPQAEIAPSTATAISHLSGAVQMETYIVTDTHIVTRNLRKNGTYDFYLFTASEGRLLCYFEGLGPQDMIPLENGGFYVAQEPYLIAPNGSAMIRTADLEAQQEDELFLHPVFNGWAVAESRTDGSANYLNQSGHTLSTLWFCRTFPFTGEYTLAYVDTGAAEGHDQRYLLYVLGADGTMSRWLSAATAEDVVACANGMAYLADGSLYHLPDTSAPLLSTAEAHVYLDCDALVVRDRETGKYGLFVHGEQHYDFVYDSIKPVHSDIHWDERTASGAGGVFTVHAVTDCSYPLPLSHSFVLEKDGKSEYVALSTQSSYPIRLEGEF